jgi:hypothetical protein
VSTRGKSTAPVVEREYTPCSDACARALELLLKKSRKEGGPATAPDDAKGSKHDRATRILPK